MRKLYSIVLSSLLFTSAFAQVPTNGLVAEWLFNEADLTDAVGNVVATVPNGVQLAPDRFGTIESARNINTGGYINFGGDQFDNITTGANATFALSFWIKLDAFDNAYRCIFAKATFETLCQVAGRQFAVLVTPAGKLQLQAFGSLGGGNHARVDGSTTLTVGEWHHVVLSVDMATILASLPATTGLTMYVDGSLETNTVSEIVGTGILPNGMVNGSAHFGFGTYLNTSGVPCATTQDIDAHFDDFRIYNRTLNNTDVQALFTEGNCPPAVVTSQPASNVGICEGSTTATISVAVAEQTTTILWQYNDGNGWGDLTGETGTDLVVALDGSYRAQLTADCGTVSYSDICSVAGTGPVINTPLASTLYICPSVGSRDITIDATGQNITYQWQSSAGNPNNMVDIQGATDATYNATAAQTYYQVIVSACGVDVTSNAVVVQNGSNNSITVTGFAPGLGTICIGQSVTIVTQVAQSSSFVWSPANGTGNGQYLVSPTETTTYTVTATSNTFGCSATTSATVTVIDPQPEIVDNGGTLEVTGGNFINYQWYLNGSPIQGITQSTYTPTADGNYTVSVTENGCTATSDPYTVTITSISEMERNGLNVYPNPFSSEFVIETLEPTSIRIVNTLGEVLMARTINGRTSIDASSLTSGIYFVQEETSGAVMKLVKN